MGDLKRVANDLARKLDTNINYIEKAQDKQDMHLFFVQYGFWLGAKHHQPDDHRFVFRGRSRCVCGRLCKAWNWFVYY